MISTVRLRPRSVAVALIALSGIALAILASRTGTPWSRDTMTVSAPLVTLSAVALTESALRDRDIEFYTRRANEDHESATDRLTLAGLLFTRSRTTGSTRDLAKAEALVRESIALRSQRNGHAFEVLASILMARHAFGEAHTIAARADSLEPGTASHLALLGEIELELGAYDAAAAHFKAVHYSGQQFTVGARVARWYEITGRASIAREILTRAIVDVDQRDDLPREQVAWFHYRLGELELRLGNLAAADSAFHRGLAVHREDIRMLGGLARTALARGNWRKAIEYGDEAIAIQLDPTALGTLAEAYSALGDSAQAAGYASAMSVSALTQPGAIHRAWGLYLLDHGSAADRVDVLQRARRDIAERRDVYGHDLLAWALYRTGNVGEAKREMQLAQSQHTEDVMLASHAAALDTAVVR